MTLRKAFLTYTLGRFGLFLLAALIAWAAGGLLGHQPNGLTLLLIAFLTSTVLSLVLLREQRARFSAAITADRETKAAAIAARRARLDDGPAA